MRLGDTLELGTMLAPNLFSLAAITGGSDAVANEMHVLKLRGWYSSSAGIANDTDGTSGSGEGAVRALTSPLRECPSGSAERAGGGPPRGLAEQGHPRKEELTIDAGTPVDSLNNSSGDREGLGGRRLDIYPLNECKPRIEDACVDLCILRVLARLLDVSVIVLLFD